MRAVAVFSLQRILAEDVMISRVEIQRYRSCQGTLLEGLGAFTVLVGRNGAGKSNILQAVDWIARTATATSPPKTPRFDEFSASMDFICQGELNRYSVVNILTHRTSSAGTVDHKFEETWSVSTDGTWHQLVSRRNNTVTIGDGSAPIEVKLPSATSVLPAIISLLPEENAIVHRLEPVLSFLASIRYYPMDESVGTKNDSGAEFIVDTLYAAWENEYKSGGRPRNEVHHKLLHLYLAINDKFQEFKELLGANGLGIIDDIHVEQFQTAAKPKAESPSLFYFIQYLPSGAAGFRHRDFVPFSALSHGTRRMMRIVLALVFDESSVMLLEHPEDGIHPGLLNKLMSVLKSYSNPMQTVAASHSPEVFNAVLPADIRLISMRDGATQARSLSSHEIDVAASYICDDGPFSDFLDSIQD